MEERRSTYADDFVMRDDETLPDVLAAYDGRCELTAEAVRRLDLDGEVPVPSAPWFPRDSPPWSVRWVLLHVIEEVARHAGHADIVRESIDGATAFELLAAEEGWPETDWLKPWRPATP